LHDIGVITPSTIRPVSRVMIMGKFPVVGETIGKSSEDLLAVRALGHRILAVEDQHLD
jgi:hypothetical protein